MTTLRSTRSCHRLPCRSCVDVTARADGGFALSARRLEIPYVKDYDAVDGEGPLHWTRRSMFRIGAVHARVAAPIGGLPSPSTLRVTDVEGRRDLSVLWTFGLSRTLGHGIGSALFERVEAWPGARLPSAQGRDAEYQLCACGFYARHGASCERFTTPRILICQRRFNSCGTRIYESRRSLISGLVLRGEF